MKDINICILISERPSQIKRGVHFLFKYINTENENLCVHSLTSHSGNRLMAAKLTMYLNAIIIKKRATITVARSIYIMLLI